MSAEAMFWIGLILVSPAFSTLGKLAGRFIVDLVNPKDTIVISYTDDSGVKHSTTVSISDDDELGQILSDIKKSTHPKKVGAH